MVPLSNKLYNALKWITMVFLPAIATLYVALSGIWNLPYSTEVSGTIMAIVVFLGIFLQINSMQYKVKLLRDEDRTLVNDLRARFVISNGMYDALKWFATILLPALSALYVAVAALWNLPYSTAVSATIAALVLFLGAVLQISSLQYRASLRITQGVAYEQNPFPDAGIFSLTNEMYDVLKFVAQAVLPGLATLYVALSAIWGFPHSAEVSATIMAVVLFMNALLQISTSKYNSSVRLMYTTSKHRTIKKKK